jgi:DNA-binding response OmpR family regulator
MVNGHSKKILAVDDEEAMLNSLSQVLRHANYEVFSTTKGKEAVNLAKNIHPDLIILDVMMPDMAGEDVAVALSSDPTTSQIPIIFLTGIITKTEELTVKKTGKRYIVAKPVAIKELVELLNKILSPPNPT